MTDSPTDLAAALPEIPGRADAASSRRLLLTRGAAAAGAAAGAVALGVAGARPAHAADGDALKQGTVYTGTKRTGLVVNSTTEPALQVANNNGPALRVVPRSADFDGTLQPGELTADRFGLVTGVADADENAFASPVATFADIAVLSLPYAIRPERLADTRSASGREGILATGGGGLDASGKLKAGAYIDIAVAESNGDFTYDAAFLNLTSTGATGNGYLFAYPPGERTTGSTTQYQKGVTGASSCLAALAVVDGYYAVRVYSSALSHVIVDLTGLLVTSVPGVDAPAKAKKSARRPAARRVRTWKPSSRR